MTLKERFKECKNKRNTYYVVPIIEDIEQLEVIADDYAIEFSKFIETHCVKTEYLHQYFFQGKEHHIKSLLEIFKKEKEL